MELGKIIEVRQKIEEINSKFDELIAPLKAKILEIEQQKIVEQTQLNDQYQELCTGIIEAYENQSYTKIVGVQVRELRDFEITDPTAIPQEYLKMEINKTKIKEKLKETEYTEKIPGVRAFVKHSVAVKL